MNTKNNFCAWLRAQADRDDPIGDLASDFKRDPQGSGVNSIEAFRRQLELLHACSGAFEAFELALTEWRRCNTAASNNTPTVKELIAAMDEHGGWYIRKRRGLRPALWKSTKRGFAPATWLDVVEFVWEWYAPEFASYTRRELRMVAEAIVAELRHHDHGLPVLTDSTLELVS